MSTRNEIIARLGKLADVVMPHLQGQIAPKFTGLRSVVADYSPLPITGMAEGLALLDYQCGGVRAGTAARRILLGDDMGVGKTPQGAAIVVANNAYPALFVVPPTLVKQWVGEFAKFFPGEQTQALFGERTYTLDPDAQVYIIGDSVVGRWEQNLIDLGLKAIVVDESHREKTHTAKRTKAVKNIARKVDGEGFRILMSGTAAENNTLEILSQLDILGVVDSIFGSFNDYLARYAPENSDGYGRGNANLAELHEILKDTVMVRRLATEVARTPGMDRIPVAIQMSGPAAEAYKLAEGNLRTYLADLRKLTPEQISKSMSAEKLVLMGILRAEAGRAKVEGTIEYVRNLVDQGEQVIVFGWHRDIVKAYAKAFNADTIMGGDNPDKVEAAKAAFQSGAKRVIVLNIKAGGVGHNLTAAKHVVFGEFAWTPSAMKQAEKRADRIGQTSRVLAHWLMASNGKPTIDERLVNILNVKGNRIGILLDGAAEQMLDDSTVEQMLLAAYEEEEAA